MSRSRSTWPPPSTSSWTTRPPVRLPPKAHPLPRESSGCWGSARLAYPGRRTIGRRSECMAKAKQHQCEHERLAVQLLCPDCGQEIERRDLSRAEMEARAIELPDREAMSLVNANIAAPINLALAANVLS